MSELSTTNVLASNHNDWKRQPVTVAAFSIIEMRLNNIIDYIAANAVNKDLPDSVIRQYGAQLTIIKKLKKELYDTESFVSAVRDSQSK